MKRRKIARTPIELLEVADEGNLVRFRTRVTRTSRILTIRLLTPLNYREGEEVEVTIKRIRG